MTPDSLRIGVDDTLYAAIVPQIAELATDIDRIEKAAPDSGHALRGLVQLLGEARILEVLTREARRCAAICLSREALGAISPLADLAFAMQGLGGFPILLGGDQAQRNEWLSRIVGGSAVAAFALTEPGAGTDLSAMQLVARRDGDSYVLNGTKTFISNAPIADFFSLFAVTTQEGERQRASAFIVPAGLLGLRITSLPVLGDHPIGTVELEEARVPASHRLGPEGGGMSLALGTLHRFRPTVGAAALGFARRAFAESVRHVRTRKQFGAPLADLVAVQHRISDMACSIDSSTALVYRAADAIDRELDRGTIARTGSMAKLLATESAQAVVDSAVQLHGGYGVLKGNIVARLYEDVRSLRIYEGTNDVHKVIIARECLQS